MFGNRSGTARRVMLALAWTAGFLSGQDLFVDPDHRGGNGSGADWRNPAPTLQDALSVARPGTTFHLAEGIYYPDEGGSASNNDVFATFTLSDGMVVLGGYEPDGDFRDRDPSVHRSVLSGDITQSLDADKDGIVDGFSGTRSLDVVTLSAPNQAPEIDGVILTGGSGQAITGSSSGLTLRHCLIQRCGGPAVVLFDPATDPVREVVIEDCRFLDNGPGLPNSSGGGLAVTGMDASIERSEFMRNLTGTGRGGGISITQNPSPTDAVLASISNCRIKGNRAIDGGGVATLGRVNLSLVNCVVSGNRAGNFGVLSSGGGIFKRQYQGNPQVGTFTLLNCTIAWNFATNGPGGVRLTGSGSKNILNTILFKNYFGVSSTAPESGVDVVGGTGQPTYFNTYDLGESLSGNGSFDSFSVGFPTFVEDVPEVFTPGDDTYEPSDGGDLRLVPGSTLSDGGDNQFQGGTTDLAGEPRVVNGTVDPGAYEVQSAPMIEITSVGTLPGAGGLEFRVEFTSTGPVDVFASTDLASFPGPPVATNQTGVFQTPVTGTKRFFVLVPAGTTP